MGLAVRRGLTFVSVFVLLLTASACAMSGRSNSSPAPTTKTATPTTTPTPQPSGTATHVSLVLQKGQVTPKVRELQGRLRQLKIFASYDLSDTFGPQTVQAVSEYQAKKGLPATGSVDQGTWVALTGETKMPAENELLNTDPGPAVVGGDAAALLIKKLQLRLKQLGHYAGAPTGALDAPSVEAVKKYQTKKGLVSNAVIDQRTLDYIVSDSREPAPWEIEGTAAPVAGTITLSKACIDESMKKGTICANMAERKVAWVQEGNAAVVLQARFGSPEHPTIPGTYTVYFKKKDLVSTIWGESIPMPWSICFDDSRCVHYSENFAKVGYATTSHGCINVKDLDAVRWMYDQAAVGTTKVFVN